MPQNALLNKLRNRLRNKLAQRLLLAATGAGVGASALMLFAFSFAHPLASQQNPEEQGGQNAQSEDEANKSELKSELKRNFIGIELGQTLEEFRAQFERQANGQADGQTTDTHYYFLYDLSTSEVEEGGQQETLVEVQGNGYIEKGVFQFAGFDGEPKLVTISIFLDPQWNSYDQFLAKFRDEYGNPSKLSPQRSIWENEQTIIALEKTLRYKIIDKEYLNKLQEREQKEFDLYQYSYEEFLKKF